MDETGPSVSPKGVFALAPQEISQLSNPARRKRNRTLYFDEHSPNEVRTPGRDRVPFLVGMGPRGRLSFSGGVLAKLELIDACKDSGGDVVTGWCGVVR
jgi:hypothetical protein